MGESLRFWESRANYLKFNEDFLVDKIDNDQFSIKFYKMSPIGYKVIRALIAQKKLINNHLKCINVKKLQAFAQLIFQIFYNSESLKSNLAFRKSYTISKKN